MGGSGLKFCIRSLSTYGPGLLGCEDLTGTGWSTSKVTHSHSRPAVCSRQFLSQGFSRRLLEGVTPNMMAGFPQPEIQENKAGVTILFAFGFGNHTSLFSLKNIHSFDFIGSVCAQPLQLQHTGLAAPQRVDLSSVTRDQTRIPLHCKADS